MLFLVNIQISFECLFQLTVMDKIIFAHLHTSVCDKYVQMLGCILKTVEIYTIRRNIKCSYGYIKEY